MTGPTAADASGRGSTATDLACVAPSLAERVPGDAACGVVLRPPQMTWNGAHYTGPTLGATEPQPGFATLGAQLVVVGNFVGVVADTLDAAQAAADCLAQRWKIPALSKRVDAPDAAPVDVADVARYRWPAASAWPLEEPVAVAWWHGDGMTVWSATDAAAVLRGELAMLLDMPAIAIRIVSTAALPSASDIDVAADAAVLSRACVRPVRVVAASLARGAEPNAETSIAVAATFCEPHEAGAYRMAPSRYLGRRMSVARLLAGRAIAPTSDDTAFVSPPHGAVALPPYVVGNVHTDWPVVMPLDAPAAIGIEAALPAVFANESFIDEAAHRATQDPLAFRLARLTHDERGAALLAQVADTARWRPRQTQGTLCSDADGRHIGRGLAYACVWDDTHYPPVKTWSAWVADVAVDPRDGRIAVTRVVVGHDAVQGESGGTDAVREAIAASVRATTRQLLQAPDTFDTWRGAAPVSTIDLAPTIEVVHGAGAGGTLAQPRAATPPGGPAWHDYAAAPAAAAVANAVFAATGIRLRDAPFGDARTQALLRTTDGRRDAAFDRGSRRRAYAWLGGIAATAASLVVAALPWRSAIAPIAAPDLSVYSAAAIDRGRLIAAAGDCVVCHTVPGGAPNAGGLGLATPFGTVYTTNITPDAETGIGTWSFAAFDRAMRAGIHRDGHPLYPAFPYTAFAKLTDGDMQSLYAYMMSQPAVVSQPPKTELVFPFNVRGLMAGWNALFHDNAVYTPDPDRSTLWNRGAYLVQGAGHCGACHTARNALGAEVSGAASFLGGGSADGWDAPALNGAGLAPLAWTESDLFDYLRTGFSARHGVAAGPMAPVIHGLAALPDSDIRAMSVYLASLAATGDTVNSVQQVEPKPASRPGAALTSATTATAATARVFDAQGEALFRGACAACHDDGATVYGAKPALPLNSNVHAARPDNLIQVILQGIEEPANPVLGYMPAFGDSFNDKQVAALVDFVRSRYAPDQPAWHGTAARVEALRAAHPD